MNKIQLRTTFLGIFFLAMILLNGCLMKSTPPGPNTAYGSVEGVSYTFHKWGEGLSVMIWHDLNGEGSCTGSGSTSDPVYREYCTVESTDGRTLDWQIHTTDGVAAEMRINGNAYNLADGVLFLIDHQDSTIHVAQLQRDLSHLATNHQSITAFAPNDDDISSFVEHVKENRLSE